MSWHESILQPFHLLLFKLVLSSFAVSQALFHLVLPYSLWYVVDVWKVLESGRRAPILVQGGCCREPRIWNQICSICYRFTEHLLACQVLCYVLEIKRSMENKQLLCVTGAHSKAWGWELDGQICKYVMVI